MYRLYVDEVGTDDLVHLHEDNHRFLSLTGVTMRIDHARDHLNVLLNNIKADIFEHDPDIPLILHRKDMMGFKGPYRCLRDAERRALFDEAILNVFQSTDYVVFTALIDKLWMQRQHHWEQKHPYHFLMEILVEKYTLFLERQNAIGDIMPERRHGKKDRMLQKAYDHTRQKGARYVSATRMQSALRGKELKFRSKKDNIAGLQLCDLLAHPSHIHVRESMGHAVSPGPFATKVIAILDAHKYDRSFYGHTDGYGIKHLP